MAIERAAPKRTLSPDGGVAGTRFPRRLDLLHHRCCLLAASGRSKMKISFREMWSIVATDRPWPDAAPQEAPIRSRTTACSNDC